MTDQLESFSGINFPRGNDYIEDDVDKLNDLTFGAELPWDFDDQSLDSVLDPVKSDVGHFPKPSEGEGKHKISTELLGLTGSFFNQGLFKFGQSCANKEKEPDDFESAVRQLSLLEKTEPQTERSESERAAELARFSESLFEGFRDVPKVNANLGPLHEMATSHLGALGGAAARLRLGTGLLSGLRYHRVLRAFLAIDAALGDINARCGSNTTRRNAEIALIIQGFTLQTPARQADLGQTHPFYGNLLALMANQQQRSGAASSVGAFPTHAPPGYRQRHDADVPEWASDDDRREAAEFQHRNQMFAESEGGWMSGSERDWLARVQTRNLTTENPYVHDFYYTKLKLQELTTARNKQLQETGHTTLPDPNKLLPSPISADQLGAGIDPTKEGALPQYRPIQFENSLGVLSASNINTPRQLIQLPPKSSAECGGRVRLHRADDHYRHVRAHRELLGLVEKMHGLVLRVDEVDKSLARVLVAPHQNSAVLMQHRQHILKLLMDCAADSSCRFVSLFSLAKGARLLLSLAAIVSPSQFVLLLRLLFFNCLSVWESPCFCTIETELHSITMSRLRLLARDDLSMLITAFFCDLASSAPTAAVVALNSSTALRPLSAFCTREFGLCVIFTVLETFLQICPEDKTHIDQLLMLVVRSVESQQLLQGCLKDFGNLFSNQLHPPT